MVLKGGTKYLLKWERAMPSNAERGILLLLINVYLLDYINIKYIFLCKSFKSYRYHGHLSGAGKGF